MTKTRITILLVAVTALVLFGAASPALAKSGYLDSFNSTYATAGTALDTCNLCHGSSFSIKNNYALAYKNAGYSYPAIEGQDSDGDGFTNIAEINARTFPGDPASKPAAGDTTAPTVTEFSIPSTSSSLTVPITSLTASDNVGVTGYLVNQSATAPSATATGWSASAPTSYTFATEGTKTLYAWAKDAAGNVSASRSATVTITLPVSDTTPPTSPSGLAATANSSTSVSLNWNASTDDVGVTGYIVLRNGMQIAVSTATSYTDNMAMASTTYDYTVKAKDAAGNVSAASNTATVTTPPGTTTGGPNGHYVTNDMVVGMPGPEVAIEQYGMDIADGVMNYQMLRSSDGGGDSGSASYTMEPDGRLTLGSGQAYGIASAEGSVVTWADAAPSDDSAIGLTMGIKTSSGMANASVTGYYLYAAMGVYGKGTPDEKSGSYLMDVYFAGNGKMKARFLRHSLADELFSEWHYGTYSVKGDGTLEVRLDGITYRGVVREDAAVFTLMDSDLADGTLSVGAGLKKSSGESVSSLSGKFGVVQIGFTGGMKKQWTTYSHMNFDGAGSYAAWDVYKSDGLRHTYGDTYNVGPTGVFWTGRGTNGLVSGDGELFIAVDTSTASDNTIRLLIGVKRNL
jgi:hypothetical protein